MKNFPYKFLRSYESCKAETWYTHGQWAVVSCIPESGLRAYNSLDRFYKFPLMKKFCHTFLKNSKGNKVETWYTHGDVIDVSCITETGPRAHN